MVLDFRVEAPTLRHAMTPPFVLARDRPLAACLGLTVVFSIVGAPAQTQVTWDRQALGQFQGECIPGNKLTDWYWPNNNNWSQSVVFSDVCSTGTKVETQPSNWSTAAYPNGAGIDVILGSLGGVPVNLDVVVILHSLTLQSDGGLNMPYGTGITANSFDFQGDGDVTVLGGGGPAPALKVISGGSITRSTGSGVFVLDPAIHLTADSATIGVNSGVFLLPGAGSLYTGGVFNVVAGAILNLVPTNNSAIFAASFSGSGAGTVLLEAGELGAGAGGVTLNFPGSLFQWIGGTISAGYSDNVFTNTGTLNLNGTSENVSGLLNNGGIFVQTNNGSLNIPFGSTVNNLPSGLFNLQADGGITAAGGGGFTPIFNNLGIFRKSAGNGLSQIAPSFNLLGGTVDVQSGTLALTGGGTSSNGTFTVSAGATLDLIGTNQSPAFSGTFTGSGAGTVLLGRGSLQPGPNGVVFNFPATILQWTGGQIAGGYSANFFTNTGILTISGSGGVGLAGLFNNVRTVVQTNTSSLNIPAGSTFNNLPSGLFELQGDVGMTGVGGGGPAPAFNNSGILRKSAGNGISQIAPNFNLLGGTVDVQRGTLALTGSGTSSNGTFTVRAGATLDLIGTNQSPVFSGTFMGSGAGTVLLSRGSLQPGPSGVAFNVTGSLLQWTGGQISGGYNANRFTNAGTMTLSGSGGVGVSGLLNNAGTMAQTGSGGVNLPYGSTFNNLPGGTFDLQSDAALTGQGGGGGGPVFNNFGIFRKSAGNGVSSLDSDINFNNLGTIDLRSGTIQFPSGYTQTGGTTVLNGGALSANNTINIQGGSVTGSGSITGSVANTAGVISPGNSIGTLNFIGNYSQASGGALNIELGGRNAAQFDQLIVAGNASLNGTLNVTLTNIFVPTIGDQFQILASGSLSGAFATLNVPGGVSVNYRTNGVFLVVSNAAPPQTFNPTLSGGKLSFSFGTVSNQSYTVQRNDDPASTNWVFYTNFIGNGSPMQVTSPVTNAPHRFFRLRQP
jgi:hypothetical protein